MPDSFISSFVAC